MKEKSDFLSSRCELHQKRRLLRLFSFESRHLTFETQFLSFETRLLSLENRLLKR